MSKSMQPVAKQPKVGSSNEATSRLFEMPYSANEPRLINPRLGLHNLVTRAGHNAGYSIDVTLLDSPDHRLIRSGLLLAHRVLNSRGEWYLGAPEWEPYLPAERIVPMGQTDIPEDFADLVRPFRRRSTLGPVAALHCERREFALRDDRGSTLALLRDDRVTVRRGGLTTARFREVTLTAVGPGLTSEQLDFVTAALAGAGATAVGHFPRLVTRLGAPATGLTDFPLPKELDAQAPFEAFVSNLLAGRLRELLEADLAVRTGSEAAALRLSAAAFRLLVVLQAISSVFDPQSVADLYEELNWIVSTADSEYHGRDSLGEPAAPGQLARWMRGERYLTLLDRLVNAARAPKLGDSSALPTVDVFNALMDDAVARLRSTGRRLIKEDTQNSWELAEQAASELISICGVAEDIVAKRTTKLERQAAKALELIQESSMHLVMAAEAKSAAEDASPEQAFEYGRSYQRALGLHEQARADFEADWNRIDKKLSQ